MTLFLLRVAQLLALIASGGNPYQMARNVAEASASSRAVSTSLWTVSTAVSETWTANMSSEQSVAEFARPSATLHGLVGQFKY